MAKQTPRERLEKFLGENGWAKDRFGHYHKELKPGLKIRIKMQATSCRLERQAYIIDKNEWLRVDGAYYKNIRFEDGTIVIGRKMLRGNNV